MCYKWNSQIPDGISYALKEIFRHLSLALTHSDTFYFFSLSLFLFLSFSRSDSNPRSLFSLKHSFLRSRCFIKCNGVGDFKTSLRRFGKVVIDTLYWLFILRAQIIINLIKILQKFNKCNHWYNSVNCSPNSLNYSTKNWCILFE